MTVAERILWLEQAVRKLRGRSRGHATNHAADGSDPIDITTLDGYPNGSPAILFLREDGTWAEPPGSLSDAQITVIIDGGGSVITTGAKKIYARIPFDFEIQGWEIVGDQSGSIVFDIWYDTYGNFPPTVADTITASAKPTVSGAIKATSSTLTGWTTDLVEGRYLEINIDSVTSFTKVNLFLYGVKAS